MLNYESIAQTAADRIIEDMRNKMFDEDYLIHKAVITVDLEKKTISVETTRKDPLGIKYKHTTSSEI